MCDVTYDVDYYCALAATLKCGSLLSIINVTAPLPLLHQFALSVHEIDSQTTI